MTETHQTSRTWLDSQYATGANLRARIELHRRFSTSPEPWHRWLFDRIEAPDDAGVLEVGCGVGELWRENGDRIPPGWRVVLTDRSPGMVAAALEAAPFADLAVADVQALPFEGASFDVAIANHMLYHVQDRPRAFAELARVLRPGGRLYAATVGRGHLEEIRLLLARVCGNAWWPRSAERFGLETAPPQLEERFEGVRVERYPSTLVVTEAAPLVAYCVSMREASGLDEARTRRLRRLVEEALERDGRIEIGVVTGLVTARRKP